MTLYITRMTSLSDFLTALYFFWNRIHANMTFFTEIIASDVYKGFRNILIQLPTEAALH